MWDVFVKDYLLLNFKDYIDPGIDFPINIFLLSIAAGLCIASVLITFHRRYIAVLIKQLMRHEAFNEENAKTLSQLRIKPNIVFRSALKRKNGQLASLISRVGEKSYTYEEYAALQKKKGFKEEKIDFSNASFYINSDAMDRAKKISEDGMPSYFKTILGCIFILVIFICVTLFMPEILSWVS